MTETTANRRRLARAWREVASLRPRDRRQKDIVRMLRAVTELMEHWSEPGREDAFEAAWKLWRHYRHRLGSRPPRRVRMKRRRWR